MTFERYDPTSLRWQSLSHQPILVSQSKPLVWPGAEFQEIQVPFEGSFQESSECLRVTLTCGPMNIRYGSAQNPFRTYPPFIELKLPGDQSTGAWQSEQRGLHLFVDRPLVEAMTNQPLSRLSFSRKPALPSAVKHLMGALLLDVQNGHPAGPEFGESLILSILHLFLRRDDLLSGRVSGSTAKQVSRRLMAFIDASLEGPISLTTLANEAGLSVRQVTRLFRQATGQSPHQFILRRRLDKAQALIRSGRMSLAEVAYAVGFSSQSHLTTAMKRTLGHTPSNVLRSLENGMGNVPLQIRTP